MLELALIGQVLLWFIVIGVFIASGQASIYHPLSIYLAFHAVVFILRPLLVIVLGFNEEWIYMDFEPSAVHLIRSLAASSLGLVIFALTSLAVGRTKTQFSISIPPQFSNTQLRGLIVTTILLAPLILYSAREAMSGGMQGRHIGGTFVLTGASGYTLEAQFMAGPIICAWLAVTRFRWQALALLLPWIMFRSYAGLARWTIVLLLIAIALVYSWQKRSKWPPAWAMLAVIPAYLLFHTLGDNRAYFQQLWAGERQMEEVGTPGATALEKFKAKYDNPDFANFDFLTFIVAIVPERTGTYNYFSQYLALFTEPIPRKLWPGKPAGAPVSFFNLNRYGDFLGRTYSLVGDGWISGGWIGVAVTMAVAGFLLGLAHRWFWRNSGNPWRSLVYLVGLAMLPQWFRDGSITIAKFLFWNLSPLILWAGISWLMGSRLTPAYSVLLPRGAKLALASGTTPNQTKIE
jgi:hypothetical protein